MGINIFIVSRGIPSPENPMSGIFEWDQAQALRDAGLSVTFIVLDLRSIRRKRNLSTRIYQRDGINIVHGSMPLGALSAPVIYNLGTLKLRKLINRAIKKFGRPDIVHGHFTDIGAITASVAKSKGIPCVVTEHSSLMNSDILDRYTHYMGNRAYRFADRFVSVSEALRTRIKQHFGVTAQVVPNIVDSTSFAYNNDSIKKKDRERIVLVASGGLIYRKGYDLLIRALDYINNDLIDVLIIGEGKERINLQHEIDNLKSGHNIKLMGRKTREDMAEIYSKADIFVLASRRETFGVVYIEAMLSGLPVIATKCGGPEEFVNENCGILIDPDNVEQLVDALKKMISNYRDYSRQKIHDYAASKFSPDVVAAQIIDVYKTLVN